MKKHTHLLLLLLFAGMQAIQAQQETVKFEQLQGQPAGNPQKTTENVRLSRPNANQPLFILDGVQIDSTTVNSINPNNIKSVTVLKDATAASIYGERATNGVVIIETKCGTVRPNLKFIPEALQKQSIGGTIY